MFNRDPNSEDNNNEGDISDRAMNDDRFQQAQRAMKNGRECEHTVQDSLP